MKRLVGSYTPAALFPPTALVLMGVVTSLFVWILHEKGSPQQNAYTILLTIAGIANVVTAFLVGYNASFLQFFKFKNIGFVFASVLFGLACFYSLEGLWLLMGRINIFDTLVNYFYSSIALLLLVALSEFHRVFKYIIAYGLVVLFGALVTSRTLLPLSVVDTFPSLSRFYDVSFWNLIAVITAALSIVNLFVCSSMLFQQFKKKAA